MAAEVSLDVPWRRRGAPNGIDERLSVDMIAWARDNGAQRLSLAFAAFPEIFNDKNRGKIASLIYTAIHLGDALIALESLYRYLRKFHALGDRRYVHGVADAGAAAAGRAAVAGVHAEAAPAV